MIEIDKNSNIAIYLFDPNKIYVFTFPSLQTSPPELKVGVLKQTSSSYEWMMLNSTDELFISLNGGNTIEDSISEFFFKLPDFTITECDNLKELLLFIVKRVKDLER